MDSLSHRRSKHVERAGWTKRLSRDRDGSSRKRHFGHISRVKHDSMKLRCGSLDGFQHSAGVSSAFQDHLLRIFACVLPEHEHLLQAEILPEGSLLEALYYNIPSEAFLYLFSRLDLDFGVDLAPIACFSKALSSCLDAAVSMASDAS